MTTQVKAHDADVKTFLDQKNPQNIEAVLSQHLLWIGFLQHERLIHLIITFFFAIIEIGLVLLIILFNVVTWWLTLITLTITTLLLFYIWHYHYPRKHCSTLVHRL